MSDDRSNFSLAPVPAGRNPHALATGIGGCPADRTAADAIARWAQRVSRDLRSAQSESMRALLAAVDAKDPYTRAHSAVVAAYAQAIGRRMELPASTLEGLGTAALLHDVGKIGVPDHILTKPGPLTSEEFEAVKRHPTIADDILGHMSFLDEVRPLILYHHEWYDGSGYPAGLVGEEIPLGARILAVADAIDTMSSPRTYKRPYGRDQIRRELQAGAGRQFDSAIVDVSLRWLDETRPTGCTSSAR